MRHKTLAIAGAFYLISCAVSAQVQTPAAPPHTATTTLRALTLPEALALAEASNPALRAKQAQLAAVEGLRADASGPLFNNPQLSAQQVRRSVPLNPGNERRSEWSTGVSQVFEVAGQQGLRRDTASAAASAFRYEIADTRRQVRAEVAERFHRVLALQQRVELEAQALKLFEDTATAVQKRRSAGEDTRLDANVAMVEAERARNQLAVAQEQLLDARNELSARLQMPPSNLPQAVGELAARHADYPLGSLLAAAEAQPRLRALAERENSANARLKLERASVYPDVTVGVNVGREGPGTARERLTTLSVSLPLPLFKRNGSGIGQARSELSRIEIERQAATRDARADVNALWSKLVSLEVRVRRLQDSVLPALVDNQQLSLKSQRAGQIGLLELIVVNRQALDARRDLIDALTEYHNTRLALELAAGWPQEGTQP